MAERLQVSHPERMTQMFEADRLAFETDLVGALWVWSVRVSPSGKARRTKMAKILPGDWQTVQKVS